MNGTDYTFFVQWHVTERCNLRCRHCYQQAPTEEMRFEEICRAIDEISQTIEGWVADYGMKMSPSLHFTGGEPFVRDDLFELLDCARDRGFSVSLLSNGTLITSDVARKVREAQVQDVQVSLDGTEAAHDAIRGDGAFSRALTGIRNLVAQDVSTSINMTISGLNYQQLDGLVQLAGELGVDTVSFSRLVPCGRGKELSEYSLTAEELSGIYGKLREFGNGGGSASLVCRDPLAVIANTQGDMDVPQTDFPVGGCAAGVFGVTITADGTIMPCRRMDLSIGNIKFDSFRQLWAESPSLIALRDRQYYHGDCRTCYYWAICRGCRAIALAKARSDGIEDYLGSDPQCAFYKPAAKV